METLNWKGYEWYYRPIWGEYHPDQITWFDKDQVKVAPNDSLILDLDFKEKVFDGVSRKWAVPWLRTTNSFSHGTFEWKAKLPKGRNLWPALWFGSDDSWPPEIDCMEGWTKNHLNYKKCLLFKNIFPTMHWGTKEEDHKSERAHEIPFWRILKPCNENSYKVVWTPDYIDIYYNDHKVKRFDDPEMLEAMNSTRFHAIMSMDIEKNYTLDNLLEYKDINKPFTITHFTYTPI